jgi:O-antigen/teichoic acid export membrane protein
MRIIATGGQIFATRLVQVLLTAGIGMVVARGLGPTGQGHYSLTLALVMLAAAVFNGGTGLAAVPLLRAGDVTLARVLRAQQIWILLATGGLALLFLVGGQSGLAAWTRVQLGWNFPAAFGWALAVVALLSTEILIYDLLALGRLVMGPLVNLGRAALHMLLLVCLLWLQRFALDQAILVYALAQSGAALFLAGWLGRRSLRRTGMVATAVHGDSPAEVFPRPGPGPSRPIHQTGLRLGTLLLRKGWLGQFSAVASLLHLRLDLALVTAFWGAAEVGIYSVAVQVGELLWLLPGALSPLLVYASAGRGNATDRDALAARAVRIGLGATAAIALPLGVLAGPLLTFFFGAEYAASAPALRALLPGIVAFAPGAVLAGDFIGRGHPVWNAQASLATVVANLAVGFYLIPRWGAVGASWASTLAYTVGAGVMIMRFRRTTGLPLTDLLLPRLSDFRR